MAKTNKKILLIDTNVFIKEGYLLNSPHFRLLKKYILNHEELEFVVPEVILSELKKNLDEEIPRNRVLLPIVTELTKTKIETKNDIVDWYEKYLLEIFDDFNANILSHKNISHKSILERYSDMIPPFRKKNGDTGGYKDTLIWLSLKERLKQLIKDYKLKVIIISKDSDFAKNITQSTETTEIDKKKTEKQKDKTVKTSVKKENDSDEYELHENLMSELKEMDVSHEVHISLFKFIEKYIEALDEILDNDFLLSNFQSSISEISTIINDGFRKDKEHNNYFEYYHILPVAINDFAIESLDVISTELLNLYEINDNELVVNLTIELYVDGSGYMYVWDYDEYLNEKYGISISKSDFGEEYKEAYASFTLFLDISIIYNKKHGLFNFDSFDIISMYKDKLF